MAESHGVRKGTGLVAKKGTAWSVSQERKHPDPGWIWVSTHLTTKIGEQLDRNHGQHHFKNPPFWIMLDTSNAFFNPKKWRCPKSWGYPEIP